MKEGVLVIGAHFAYIKFVVFSEHLQKTEAVTMANKVEQYRLLRSIDFAQPIVLKIDVIASR